MIGHGTSYGAITVLNAMACGIGCTIGTELTTEASFEPEGETRSVVIMSDPTENDIMARICVKRAFERIGLKEPEGWILKTSSEIPVSRGLKSSSSACNAIISSVLNAMDRDMPQIDIVRLGVECAREAKVTITGSFDDACGCMFGGLVITDNVNDKIIMSQDVDEMDVVMSVPRQKIRKTALPVDKIKAHAEESARIAELAKTDPLKALTENGRLFAQIIGVDNSVAERALKYGALAAGMSGAGPAIAVLTERGKGFDLAMDVGMDSFIITQTRHRQ
jgi:shikimate kinase